MKFISFAVVCLFGVAFSAPAPTKQKRDILPGDSRYGTDYHLHHHHNHENEFQSASNNYLAPAIDAAQTSASENNAYLAPAATDSVSPAVTEHPSESVPREVSIHHSAKRQPGHQQIVQNTVIQTASESHSSADHPVHQQTVQNVVIQTAPQTYGSNGHHAPQQTVQNTILQSAPQTNGHVKQTVQNTVLQSASEMHSSGSESSDNIGDSADAENEVDASEVSQTYGSESSNLSFGQQGESTNVFQDIDSADQKTTDAPQTYHYKLIVKHYPQEVKTHVEAVDIDDSEAHASEQMTLIGSNGGYVY